MSHALDVSIGPWREEDLTLLRALNAPGMKRHLGGSESEEGLAVRHRKYVLSNTPSARRYRIIIASAEEPVGSVGYWEREWRGGLVYEMGWGVLQSFQGRGIATVAVRLALSAAGAENLHRFVHAFPAVENVGSNAVCRGVGFSFVGECGFEYPPGENMRCNEWSYDLASPDIADLIADFRPPTA